MRRAIREIDAVPGGSVARVLRESGGSTSARGPQVDGGRGDHAFNLSYAAAENRAGRVQSFRAGLSAEQTGEGGADYRAVDSGALSARRDKLRSFRVGWASRPPVSASRRDSLVQE